MRSAFAVDIAAARSAETTTPARIGVIVVRMTWVSTAPGATSGDACLPTAPTSAAQKLMAMTRMPDRMQPHLATAALLADW